jgi:Restriction endonuclease
VSDYSEKLKHPLWQRKRLEILSRDGFQCRCCKSDDTTLHVHHLKYDRGRDPWDYPDSALITLCETCHEIEHETQRTAQADLIDAMVSRGATSFDLTGLAVAVDESGPNDNQISADEWSSLAQVIGDILRFRHAGGDIASLGGLVRELCAQEGQDIHAEQNPS